MVCLLESIICLHNSFLNFNCLNWEGRESIKTTKFPNKVSMIFFNTKYHMGPARNSGGGKFKSCNHAEKDIVVTRLVEITERAT